MSINWCYEYLGTKITSTAVSADGHHVTNLIKDPNAPSSGFKVEYFQRPPVDVIVEFPTEIDIQCIIVGTRMMDHQVDCMELYAKSHNSCVENMVFQWTRRGSTKPHQCFANSMYRADNQFINEKFVDHQPSFRENIEDQDLLWFAGKNLSKLKSVIQLRVRVTKTHRSTIPCMSRLAVYGKPSAHSSSCDTIPLLNKAAEKLIEPSPRPMISLYGSQDVGSSVELNQTASRPATSRVIPESQAIDKERLKEIEIPKEYCDALTDELMIVPITLPCGKNVDKATLDKMAENDRMWRRLPSDPFTGIPFSAQSQPIPNNALKLLIDDFIVKNHLNMSPDQLPNRRIVGGYSSKPSRLALDETIEPSSKRPRLEAIDCAFKLKSNIVKDSVLCSDPPLLYQISCGHLMCRAHLMIFKSQTFVDCISCGSSFDPKKAIKFHAMASKAN